MSAWLVSLPKAAYLLSAPISDIHMARVSFGEKALSGLEGTSGKGPVAEWRLHVNESKKADMRMTGLRRPEFENRSVII
jgi:hypothetical protein